MKRYVFLIIFSLGFVAELSAQTIESVMCALQERYLLTKRHDYAQHQLAYYNVETKTYFPGYTPLTVQPIDWAQAVGRPVAAYPAKDALNGFTKEECIKLLNEMRRVYSSIRNYYVYPSNSKLLTDGSVPRVDRAIVESPWPIHELNYQDAIADLASKVSQLKCVVWSQKTLHAFPVTSSDGGMPSSELPIGGGDVGWYYSEYATGVEKIYGRRDVSSGGRAAARTHTAVGESYWAYDQTIWPSGVFYEKYEWTNIYGGNSPAGGFGPLRENPYRLTNNSSSTHLGFVFFTGTGVGGNISGDFVALGRQMPNDHLSPVVSLTQGNWPAGYAKFKGYREWATWDNSTERVDYLFGDPYWDEFSPPGGNFGAGHAIGSISGSWEMTSEDYAPVMHAEYDGTYTHYYLDDYDIRTRQWAFIPSGGTPTFGQWQETGLIVDNPPWWAVFHFDEDTLYFRNRTVSGIPAPVYHNTSGLLLFRPVFQYSIEFPASILSRKAPSTTGELSSDMRGQLVYIDLGRGLDGVARGFLGFGPSTERNRAFDGFGSVIDLAILTNPLQFEAYYALNASEMPFASNSMWDHAYREKMEYYNGDELVLDCYVNEGFPESDPRYYPGVEWYVDPRIQQIVGLDLLVNVEVIMNGDLVDPTRYVIKLYKASQKGAFSNGRYEVSGQPFDVIQVSDSGPSGGGDLHVDIVGLSKKIRIDYDAYEGGALVSKYDMGDGVFELGYSYWVDDQTEERLQEYHFDGFTKITTESLVSDVVVEEVYDRESRVYTRSEGGAVVSSIKFLAGDYFAEKISPQDKITSPSTLQVLSGNSVLKEMKFVLGGGPYSWGEFPFIKHSTGPGWFWLDYDGYGRVTKRIDQLGSNSFPASTTQWPDTNNITTENTYDGNTQTTVNRRAGQVTGRSWRVWNGLTEVSDYVATDLSASAYSENSNLKTTTTYYGGGETTGGAEPWAIKSIVYPDGTASVYSYSYNTSTKQKTVTVSTGQPNAPNSPTSIVKGKETVTITNFQGYVLSSVTKDIASNTILVSEVVPSGSVDDFGRPTRINFLDGTHVSRTYYPDFRGLVQTETDRNGVESTYTYDILNRLKTVVRDGVTTTIAPAGLTTATTYSTPSGGSHTEVSTVNLLGQLVSSSSTFEPSITTNVTRESGRVIYTTTDTTTGLTVIKKYYEDGSLESVSGTGTKHYRYEYGVESFTPDGDYRNKSLSFTKEILLADNGADSATYVKTYLDGAGRTVVVETPSGTGSGTAYAYSYYNDKGQLWKTVDADGVIRILGYDEQGRQTAVALDVNKNGTTTTPFDSADEVTTTTTTYADGKATTVTEVGLGTGARELSRSVTTISSGATTVTTNGNANLVTTITPNVAAKSVTVSGADGQATYIYDNNGQPASYTVKDSANTTLKTTTYSHDKFGRLGETTGSAAGASFVTTFNPDGTLATSTATATGLTSQSLSVTYSTEGTNRRMVLNTNGKTQTIEVSGKGDLVKRSGFGTFDMDLTHERGTTGTTTTLTTAGGIATTFEANAAGVTTGKTFTGNTAGPSTGYSAGGRPLAVATPAGADATYGYGTGVERGLVKTINYPPSSNTANVAINYDEQGRVKTITDASGTRILTYDKDQLDTETYTAGPLNGLVIDRSFDTRDRRSGLSLKKGTETLYSVGYGYHGNTSDLENVTKNTWSSHYTYKANTKLIDKVIQKRNGTAVLTTTRNYDAFKRLASISSTAGSNTTSYAYHYNAAGQRDTITRENQDYWDIGYQADGQLHTAVKKNEAGVAYPGFNYAYDFTGIGSRSKTATNDTPDIDREAVYTPNDLNQVTSREVPGFVDVLGSIDALTEVTVDVGNTSSPVTKKGAWNVSTAGSGFHGTGYLQDGNSEKGKKWVDYGLVVTPGTYTVELIWVADAGNSSAVPVIINAGDVRRTRVVNQQANGGTWVSVGTYTMTTGGHLSVRIANMGTTGRVVADAVRIKRTSGTWEQILDSESATLVTTLSVAKLGDIFYKAIPVDNSAGPVAVKIDITGLLAGAGENGTDAVASFETSAIVPPANTALANDLDGRRKDDWKWTYTWNAAGQLRSVESTTAYVGVGGPQIKLVFDYDAQGRRFSKKVYRDGATTASETLYFIYDGWNLIAELSDTLAVVRSYTWGPDISQTYQGAGGIGGLLTIQTGPSTTYFPVYDGSGNITGLVNATTGTVDAVYEYAPFGEPVRVSGVAKSVSPFGFSTKYTDSETGFCYYGHRYYDPELGHWISREPLGEMESANLYAFCGNDPINNVDYIGLQELELTSIGGQWAKDLDYRIASEIKSVAIDQPAMAAFAASEHQRRLEERAYDTSRDDTTWQRFNPIKASLGFGNDLQFDYFVDDSLTAAGYAFDIATLPLGGEGAVARRVAVRGGSKVVTAAAIRMEAMLARKAIRSTSAEGAELLFSANGMRRVSTGGLRNEVTLTASQLADAKSYARSLGATDEMFSVTDNINTAYGNMFGKEILQIGTDVLPVMFKGTSLSANSMVTMRGAIAHELVGHRAASLAGKVNPVFFMEEMQASLRAAKFAPGLSNRERMLLWRDAMQRMPAATSFSEIRASLWLSK